MTAKITAAKIGRRFKAARLRRRYSQSTVSRRAGLAPSYLSRIERGKPNPSVAMALRLAEALRMPLGDILAAGEPPGKEGACPVSADGQCLIDLIDAAGRSGTTREVEHYSPRQLRLLRRFAALLQQTDEDLLSAFETLVRKNLREEAGARSP